MYFVTGLGDSGSGKTPLEAKNNLLDLWDQNNVEVPVNVELTHWYAEEIIVEQECYDVTPLI